MNDKPLFYVDELRIQYPSSQTWAVDQVSFTLEKGEKIGLVGESGCGKSTIGKAAMGLLPKLTQIEGKIQFQGESIFKLDGEGLRRFRGEVVGLVFQDPMTRLDPLMTIGEHCLETLLAHRPQLSRKEAKNIAIKTLEKVKIPPNRWGQYPHEFSGGMRQRVAMALALLLNPKMIIADEPTTALDVTVAAEILQELTRLCQEEEMGLLLISHDLAMVGEYCDRLAVMNEGKIVEMGPMKDILHHPNHDYTKSLLKAALHVQVDEDEPVNTETWEENNHTNKPLLSVSNLKQYFTLEGNFIQQFFSKEPEVIKAVDDVSFDLHSGEILGLVGESGCGKSTLSRTLLQLLKATSGTINFLGEELTQLSESEMRLKRRQLQMIFQDPNACLNPLMTVGQSIADPLFIHKLATVNEAKKEVHEMLERVKLTPVEDYYYRYPKELSGGQQQRVAIARALITKPKLVICDEPVSMLDASVQARVLDLMSELKNEFDLTYLFITHDLWVARFFCHRIAVMNQGKIVEIGETESIFKQPQHPYTQKLLNAAPLLVI
ncbi:MULTISPECIES: ABC transporter ATP-binding protein [Crocosphaera]|uniref:ATP-binding protein of ABC transporter n=3 Tax=Crocosphaera watsonii TaxID=263511 RepID=T2K0G9_CROWT|nr:MULTISPECIES: ABC transporter ATP-binding protein [Crocosphaera]EHJ12273.1 ATP-binding protein of ABC transporter [Crocosphaera watsonii WH 0003]MCH2243799.1 ABC transporter ATP-binding protein [Crocosphaera sp.]NQZ60872.1 ABC transporter ATP-binding protein [Crocosphaera sp.]CCQ54759.1 ATP-binding protein of ABC transporter [Crocosphaera watsonii WH 0005]CCQ70477.1 ATP-binding protein of ABC transporter [Crocosphaera watsonii WH 0402]